MAVFGMLLFSNQSDKKSDVGTTNNPNKSNINSGENNLKYSLTDPSSPWIIVNKHNSIPTSYVPELTLPNIQLRLSQTSDLMKVSPQAKQPIEKLFAQAANQGINLRLASGYRSAATQESLYNSYVTDQGQAEADKFSARPGYSEHQTGLAVDLVSSNDYCFLDPCWGETKEAKWLAENAYKYGFIIRYLEGKQTITGYNYEPWHLRFLGTELATKVHQSGKTLEEYLDLEPAPTYQ
ncbi:M15 family metallopeptidase [Candidatus Saccharibacteria bacterium]|nr:M15 family metallopeptidase [Candidatus Saccharibacteria bacterium]